MLAVSGCGGDDDAASTTPTATETPTTSTETTATDLVETTETDVRTAPGETETSPAAAPEGGGEPNAGDEEPARTLALLTGRGRQITPRLVRVPAFIAIEVRLRSADGGAYALRFGSVTVRADGPSTTFGGLRPSESIVGVPIGGGNRVRISATAEPGP